MQPVLGGGSRGIVAGGGDICKRRRGAHSVYNEGPARHRSSLEAVVEKKDLSDAHWRRTRDEDERDLGAAERGSHCARALFEAAEQIVELCQELSHGFEKACAGDPTET